MHLNPEDREQFAAYEQQMTNELEEYLAEHARREGYSLTTRPRVSLETEPELSVGLFGISVESSEPADGGRGGRCRCPAVARRPCPSRPPRRRWCSAGGAAARAAAAGEPRWCTRPTDADAADRPSPNPATEIATLTWERPRRCELTRQVSTIGRSSSCAIVVHDANVSRTHAEIRRIGEGYSLVDLGSTNGTEVNGLTVSETALMNGDVIGVGQTRLTFERRLG